MQVKPKLISPSSDTGTHSKITRTALISVQIAGLALLCYWGWHLYAQMQFLNDYHRDALHDINPLLEPGFRIAIDVLAILAGVLMLKKSKWALPPYALHFAAYLCFVLSITGYDINILMLPRVAMLIMGSQILVLALLLWLEAKKALDAWPLRGGIKRN